MDRTESQIIKELKELERKPMEANWQWVLQRIKPICERKELKSGFLAK